MRGKYLDNWCAHRAPHNRRSLAAGFFAATMFTFAGSPAVSADEDVASSDNSSSGNFMICVREQSPLGGYGPERCISRATLTSGLGGAGFGPAAYWIGAERTKQPAMHYRFKNTNVRPEFRPLDIEATTRSRAPAAIWMLSYNIKDLASTLPDPTQYWTEMRLDGHQSIGLSALDPAIERNSTGVMAIGLRISLAY